MSDQIADRRRTFDTPVPPAAPLIAPPIAAVGQRRDRASVRHARAARRTARGRSRAAAPPFPPLIAPLLVSVVIVPALARPAPPAPRCRRSEEPPPPPLIVAAYVLVSV